MSSIESSALATQAVPMCQLREGDQIAFASGLPAESEVALAEYAPVGACIAFRIGTRGPDGETVLMPTIGWGRDRPGTYSWSDHAYMTPAAAELANARVSLFHEVYPEDAS